MIDPFPLGAFQLRAHLGSGASGDVFAGVHAVSGVPVAIKVLRGEGVASPRTHEAFREEVRAVARLDHPGVVLVFEHGVVSPHEGRASGERVTAGAPWLAMEYASRGTLDQLDEVLAWRDVRGILLALLAALGHAHARGVLHRDVKPGNVLLGARDDLRPAVRLADFGLAFAMEQGAPGLRACGTPAYMAPEQLEGRWRSFCPATDLYALGCIAWSLLTGAPPFVGASVEAIATQHRFAGLPPLHARCDVPEGVEAWLSRILAKAPGDRFSCAADAADGLASLGAPVPRVGHGSAFPGAPSAGVSVTTGLETLHLASLEDVGSLSGGPATHAPAVAPMPVRVPSVPPTWRPERPAFPVPRLHGAGLSLWGLREAPLTHRDAELDLAWAQLVAAAGGHEVRAVVLRGEPGVGKSRLARTLAERAAELGVANVLKATHGPTPGARDGLAGMLARRFATAGLAEDDVAPHLCEAFGALGLGVLDAGATADLLRPDGSTHRPRERWGVVRRVLEAVAGGEGRPVLLWIDDGQWGADAVAFAAWLATHARFPCLVVLTCHAQVPDPAADAALAALVALPRTRVVDVAPLDEAAAVSLCAELVGLDEALARRVARVTGGNPLFLEQLLGSWIARGDLSASGETWALAVDAPATLRDAWEARLSAALRGLDGTARARVDAAAILGDRVQDVEWSAVCATLGWDPPTAVREALVATRLAIPEHGGWSFAHGLLREAVLVGARDPVALHAAAARALARAGAAAGRIANHLEQAGDLEGAAVALVAELERRVDATEVVAAERVAAQAEQLLDAVRAPAGDSRRVRVLLQRARAADLAGRCHEGIALAQTAVDLLGTAASTMPSLAVEARIALATCLRGAGRYADAESTLRVALEHAGEGTTLRARALLSLARVDLLSGALPRAERHLNDALGTFETAAATDADALPYAAECVGRIGDVARQRGDFVAAARRFEDAATRYRAIGHVSGESTQLHGLAEAHRLLGRLADAEAGYHRTIAMDASVGKDTSIPRFNLSLCLLARGSAEAAEATLLGLEDEWRRAGRADMVAYALAGRVCTAAMRGDRAEGGGRFAAYLAAADAGGVDIDLAQLMERAATAWRGHGEADHADACAEVALAQWRALGDTEAVSRVEASLSRRARDG